MNKILAQDGTTSITKNEVQLLLAGAVLLVACIFIFQRPPFYDEDDYLSNVQLLHQYGFGKTFLLKEIGSAGPLYAVIHYFLEPITCLKVPGLRLVNIFLLTGVIFFTAKLIRLLSKTSPQFSYYILAIPFIYLCCGLVLTEMPAMFF